MYKVSAARQRAKHFGGLIGSLWFAKHLTVKINHRVAAYDNRTALFAAVGVRKHVNRLVTGKLPRGKSRQSRSGNFGAGRRDNDKIFGKFFKQLLASRRAACKNNHS